MRGLLRFVPLLLASCTIPNAVESLGDSCPPAEFGRPGWVRVCAGTGAWIGGAVGGVISIVALPITWPLSWLAEDELGERGSSEFLLAPAVGGAALGHAALGAPADVLDWVFRRAWVGGPDPVTSYEFVPMPDPAVLPRAAGEGGEKK